MTQLSGTETSESQKRAAEAFECGQQGVFWKALSASRSPMHSREPSKYGKKGRFCTVRTWMQAAKEGEETNANILSLQQTEGKVNLKLSVNSNQLMW